MNLQPYLREVASASVINKMLRETLDEILEIKDKYQLGSQHLFYDYNKDDFSEGSKENFIDTITGKISDAMHDKGLQLAKERFSKFSPGKTKITPDIIEEMWHEASRILSQEIYAGFEEREFTETNRIPGLYHSIRRSEIRPIGKDENQRSLSDNEQHRVRENLIKREREINERDEFLRRFREKYFQHMKKEFGLFHEQDQEITSEFKPNIK